MTPMTRMTLMTRMSQKAGITEFQKQTVRGSSCLFCYLTECCRVFAKMSVNLYNLYFFIQKDIQKDRRDK